MLGGPTQPRAVGRTVGGLLLDLFAAKVELGEPLGAVELAVGDAVEVFFHLRGELVVDQVAKVLLEKAHNGERDPLGHQCLPALGHESLADDVRHDVGIRRWTANAVLFECLDQRCFGIAGWRRGAVVLCGYLDDAQLLADREVWQLGFALLFILVANLVVALFVCGQEALERDDGSGCRELEGLAADERADRDLGGGGRDARVGHLRCHGALPDQVIKVQCPACQDAAEVAWGLENLPGWTDCLVRLLGVLRLAGVDARLVGD